MVWQKVVNFRFDRKEDKYELELENKKGKRYKVRTDFGSADLIAYEWINYSHYRSEDLWADVEFVGPGRVVVNDVGWRW